MQPSHETRFLETFGEYELEIQAAGVATIPSVSRSADGHLTIAYRYQADGERRTGRMTLTPRTEHRYEGDWRTIADTGQVYEGTLWLVFAADGTAVGAYLFAGQHYRIAVNDRPKTAR
jgi:hypothetical protein